jgi:hypothetical protein
VRLEDGSWLELDRWFSGDPDLAEHVVVPASVLLRWQSMGEIAESSGAVEVCLQQIFVALMDTRRASIVASGQNASWLVDNCLAILREPSFPHTEDTSQLIKVLQRAPGVLRGRNDLLHAFWVRHEGGDARVNTRYRKGPTLKSVETAEPASAAERLRILEELLADLGYRIFGDKMSWHSVAVGRPESVAYTVDDLDPDAPSRRAAPGPFRPAGKPTVSKLERQTAQILEVMKAAKIPSPLIQSDRQAAQIVEIMKAAKVPSPLIQPDRHVERCLLI